MLQFGSQIRLSDSKIYLQMSSGTWLVSDPVNSNNFTIKFGYAFTESTKLMLIYHQRDSMAFT